MTYKKVGDAIGPHVTKVATDSGHEFELPTYSAAKKRG